MERARTLVIVRHAKAEEYAASDIERELTSGGRADAAEAGRWLAAEGVVPTAAYVSSAARTRGTWDEMSAAAGWDVEPTFERAIYETEEEGLLELIREVEPETGTLVVIGHNPTVAVLAQMLDDGEGPAEIGAELVGGYPTCSVTVFDVPVPWSELAQMRARPRAFHVGRA